MTRTRSDRPARTGFTLIELLVVIGIIAVLVSLLAVAVNKSIVTAEVTSNRMEISKLAEAIEAFKAHFHVGNPPSKFRLEETLANYDQTNLLERESLTYLRQMFPNITFPIDWNQDGATTGGWTLEGDQCLVFFLGGMPSTTSIGVLGFSTNKRNPASFANAEVIPPFYEFRSDRLVRIHNATDPTNIFYSYLDYFGRSNGAGLPEPNTQPYRVFAYFSSKADNDYDRHSQPVSPLPAAFNIDCDLLRTTSGLQGPYAEGTPTVPSPPLATPPPKVFFNRTGYQIISPGLDGIFGPAVGLQHDPKTYWHPSLTDRVPAEVADNQANFHNQKLGD